MFVPYDLFVQVGHAVFLADSVVNSANNPLELSPELLDGIRVDHDLFPGSIPVPAGKFVLRMIRSGMMVMHACGSIGYPHIRTEEGSRFNRAFHKWPKSFLSHVENHVKRYSSRDSLNHSHDDFLVFFSPEPSLVRFGFSRKKKFQMTSFFEESGTNPFE